MFCLFACYCRLIITGPVSHYFYQLMEVWMPTTDPYCIVKRLLLDRLFFAPGFLLIFYFVMNVLEVSHVAPAIYIYSIDICKGSQASYTFTKARKIND